MDNKKVESKSKSNNKIVKPKNTTSKKFGYEGELFKKRQELVKPIQDKVFDACQNIAKKSALDFIFAKGGEMIMMYSNARYDKSDEVLIELGVNVTKNKGNAPDQNSNPDNSSSPRPGGLKR
jgi:outer membrane protein